MFELASGKAPLKPTHIGELLMRVFTVLTKHYQLHQPEHVGMFAGSLLLHSDWNHPSV